jgi:hypothetical protein
MYMRGSADVRFFLPMAPAGTVRTFADLAFDYLTALTQTALPLLCLANSQNADLRPESRYGRYSHLFTGSTNGTYVNFVAAAIGSWQPARKLPLGDGDAELPAAFDLCRLYTIGVPNVALVGFEKRNGQVIMPQHEERQALKDYQAVIGLSPKQTAFLGQLIGRSDHLVTVPPTPDALEFLFRRLLYPSTR